MFLDSLINIIFPSHCLNCRKNAERGGVICADCFGKISLNQTLFCGKCRARIPDQKKICHNSFPYLLGAAGSYGDETLKNLIHGLKFQYLKSAARPLGEILIRYTDGLGLPLEKFSVIPVPLSKKRLRERGFNQSELIAKILAEHFGLPIDASSLTRAKNTKPQSETKNLAERRENVRACFFVTHPEAVAGRNILLIDDVTTSGATLFEAASALKSAGARKILAMTVAKT